MLQIKTFEELSNKELYEILKLRMEVFIVELGGCYQDLDDIDYNSIHIFHQDQQGVIDACIRLFPKEDEESTIQLGRLVVRNRKNGLGKTLMEASAQIAKERYGAKELYLTGREAAYGFYQKCGFYAPVPKVVCDDGCYYILRRSL